MEIVLLSVSVMLMRDLIEFAERETLSKKKKRKESCVTLGLLSCEKFSYVVFGHWLSVLTSI